MHGTNIKLIKFLFTDCWQGNFCGSVHVAPATEHISSVSCPLLAAKHSLTNTANVSSLFSVLSATDMFLSRIVPDWLFSVRSQKLKIDSLFIVATVELMLRLVWWFV
jgi:hypothetical protein